MLRITTRYFNHLRDLFFSQDLVAKLRTCLPAGGRQVRNDNENPVARLQGIFTSIIKVTCLD
jgi:hypothetical protein